MPALAQQQRYRVKRVLGKQLGAADDDRDKSHGVQHEGDELMSGESPDRHGRGHADTRQPHGHAAGESGKRQGMRRAPKFGMRVFFHPLENLPRRSAEDSP